MIGNKEITVLDKGFIRLDAVCADDLSVINSARVSFNKRHEKIEEGDDKLIGFLLANRHETPFEANFFRFHIKAPIFVFREWHRHRIGISINEMSGRYVELEPEFYIPDHVRKQVGKPGKYTFQDHNNPQLLESFNNSLIENGKEAWIQYQSAIKAGIAKEMARMFLPVNLYSQMYWSCNARSLMHFINLRNSAQAQYEIREYAKILEDILCEHMPITGKYFRERSKVNE